MPTTLKWSARAGRYYRVKVAPIAKGANPREQFEQKYVPLRPKMVKWAMALIHRWDAAEDATQSALLHIMLAGDLGRTDHNPEAHAYQALRNEIRKISKDAARWVPLPEEEERDERTD